MDDEASLLPRKLQAALEQALEQRNDIINQDSDSESDEGERAAADSHGRRRQMFLACLSALLRRRRRTFRVLAVGDAHS